MITITPGNLGAFAAMLSALQPAITAAAASAAQAIATDVAGELASAAPKGKTGKLAGSFTPLSSETGTGAEGSVETSEGQVLKWVTEGTGVYGPTGQRIRPTQARALFWRDAGNFSPPYASVAGQPPNDFVSPVLAAADGFVQNAMDDMVAEIDSQMTL